MKFLLLFIGFVYLTSYEADAHSTGAPESTCKTMTPKHGVDPQSISAPYKLSVKSQNGRFEVSIQKSLSDTFRGFFLQARERDNPDEIVDGEFSLPSNAKFVKCNNVDKNAITHDSRVEKNEITTVWTPKSGYNGNIIFRATVVKIGKEFWTNIDSDPVEVFQPQIDNSHSSTDVTTKNPTTSGHQSNSMYENCGKERGCFGMLENCIERQNCLVLLSYFYDPERDVIEFEISTKIGSSSDLWIAAGISEDKSMGSDSVADCIFADGKPSFHYSWNEGKSNKIMDKIPEIVLLSTSTNDGTLSCRWTRKLKTVEKDMTFDLMANEYYLLLAKGSLKTSSPIEKKYHDNAIPSSNRVNFTSISIITGNQNVSPLIKAHGSLMVIAWAGLVSVGILLARHYKDGWSEKTLCNVKIWFAFHRGFMVTAVLMIVTAFILIFVHVGQWSSQAQLHAVLGCIATGFAILQPIGALFRPGPTDSKRPIFNWLHWLGGNAGFVLAIVTIFVSTKLSSVKLPTEFTWVFAIFVIYYVLFQILIQVYVFQLEKRKKNEINMIEMSGEKVEKPKDSMCSTFKEKLLAIFVLPVIILVITLVVIICLQ